MPLSKQKIDLILTQGVNQKTDKKSTLLASLINLENVRFQKIGALSKRPGSRSLGFRDCNNNLIENPQALLNSGDELLMAADDNLFSYSESADLWVNKGSLVSASVTVESLVANSAEQTSHSSANLNNITMTAWNDTRGGVRYSVKDEESDVFFVSDEELDEDGSSPVCVAVGTSLICIYGDSTSLKCKFISFSSPCILSDPITIRTDLDSSNLIDAIGIGTRGFIFYKTNVVNTIRLVEISAQGVLSNTITIAEGMDTSLAITNYIGSDGNSYLNLTWFFTSGATFVKFAIYTQSLVEHVAVKNIDIRSDPPSKITLVRTNNNIDQVTVLYSLTFFTTGIPTIYKLTVDLDGTNTSSSEVIRKVDLATRAFLVGETIYFNSLYESELQSTVFTMNIDGVVVAKYLPGNSGTFASLGSSLTDVSLSNGRYIFPTSKKGIIRSENAKIFSRLNIATAYLDFSTLNTYGFADLNNNLHIAGGVLQIYDKDSVVEQGFHLFPEGLELDSSSTTGGSLSDGQRIYFCVYQWIDDSGNTHRSAPSVGLSVTLAGGTATQTVDITVPYLSITRKKSPRTNLTIEMFRTEDLKSIPYRVSSIDVPIENQVGSFDFEFTDGLSDSEIIGNEILYTVGGILDNIAAPSCDFITTHDNRIFLAGLENRNEIRYSKIVRDGEGVAFNEALSIKADPKGGGITQIVSMDTNLIIFKSTSMRFITGEGPSDTGQGATFTEPQLITSSSVGCVDPQSVVLGQDGIYFKSKKGIYLLTRTLETRYIGDKVEDFNSSTIVSAQAINDLIEIRFATDQGVLLCYNYFFNQWSIYKNRPFLDTVIWNDLEVAITTDDVVIEDSTTSKDINSNVSMKVETGWIKLSGIQGFQRAYRASFLGEYKSRHILRISVYTDYSDILVQRKEFTTNEILSVDNSFYGDDVYGDSSPYGGADNGVYQFQIHLKRQKCQAIRFVIEDLIDNSVDSGTGESLSLSAVSLLIGSKRGLNKLRTGKTG